MPTTLTGFQKPGHQWAYIADSEPAAIAATLVAFANSDGGWLVLGIDAEGTVGALRTDDEMADAVRAAERLCRPPVRTVDWQQREVSGGAVAVIRVERSSDLHALEDGRVLLAARCGECPGRGR
jgi:ATP-dependent DNA helicase RecG